MQVVPTPDKYSPIVVIGASLRKSAAVLQFYFDSLASQEIPPRVRVHYVFVDDGLEPDAKHVLQRFLEGRAGEVVRGAPSAVGDFSDQHPTTHQWSVSAMRRVGDNKDRILRRSLELGADAVWLVDGDLLCDRTTFTSLWHSDKPIACAVYWTHWHKQGHETRELHAAPQVWLRHPYQLDGRGMDEFEFRRKLLSRNLTQVWGQGACTLIRRLVLEAGVKFEALPDVPQVGMMAGEDRHFCIRAERLHIPMFADPWPDIFHIYHLPDDLNRAKDTSIWVEHPKQARLGDLVSLKLQALEPMPMPNNQWAAVPSQHVRGRLGQIALLPELEEAVWNLTRGEERIVSVHFPYDYPVAYLRGRRRLVRMQMVDCKSFTLPPVVGEEMFVGPLSRRYMDSTGLSETQHRGLEEIANG